MLPYQTLEEAASALGRNLTLPEKLWFNYSANKSDLLLFSHNTIFLCLVFSLAPLPYAFIELSQSEYMTKFKVQTKIKTSFSDMFKCYKDVMKTFIFFVAPLQILSFPTVKVKIPKPVKSWAYEFEEISNLGTKLWQGVGIRTSLPLPSMWEMLSQLVVYFLIEDYTNYWLHRLLHCKWGYEKIHHVHHEYSSPFGFAAPYAHWAEILILGFPTFLGPTMVPCHMITLYIWAILRHVEAIQTHSGYEFPWSPTNLVPFYVGAEYHDYHHFVGRQSQSNFASVFTYCDYIYGTDRGYRHHKQALNKLKDM
ncbi:Fatty acid hydroxylase [Corchorus olitorius]|uniref:Fatty acid hydroxylase n=1 Tax=Corchorus olitorius TaxID=93759 RepID=A0A1R3K0G1_9ROSI|nr:Fatty acid hydroxylase [Corchorus olitorius]